MPDLDLEIRREVGGFENPEPEIRRRGPVCKKFFSALWASVWSENKGGTAYLT